MRLKTIAIMILLLSVKSLADPFKDDGVAMKAFFSTVAPKNVTAGEITVTADENTVDGNFDPVPPEVSRKYKKGDLEAAIFIEHLGFSALKGKKNKELDPKTWEPISDAGDGHNPCVRGFYKGIAYLSESAADGLRITLAVGECKIKIFDFQNFRTGADLRSTESVIESWLPSINLKKVQNWTR